MAKPGISRGLRTLLGEGRAVTRIGPRLRIRGDLQGAESFYIEGRVEGNVTVEGTTWVAEGGSVLGDLRSTRVIIDGTVEGDVFGTEAAHLRSTGRLVGDLRSPRPRVSEGAFFQGQIFRDEPAS